MSRHPHSDGDDDAIIIPLPTASSNDDEQRDARSRHPSRGADSESAHSERADSDGGVAAVLEFAPPATGSAAADVEPEAPATEQTPGTDAAADEAAADAPADEAAADAPADEPGAEWQQQLADLLAEARRRLEGDYTVDEAGFDPEFTERVLLPAVNLLYDHWFRVDVSGAEHLPVTGGALLVANHAGGLWPVDGVMLAAAVRREHPTGRFLRPLAADLVFGLPVVGTLARRGGTVPARRDDADRLLRTGELVGVWPEGFAGIGKPFRDRYQLQRFGRGGFVRSAIRAGVPLIPVSMIGAEEIHPVIGHSELLARLLDLPYFPLTPTFPWLGPLGLIPLPSKWHIEFGEPIPTDALDPSVAEDPETVFDLSDRVRDTIQATLDRLLLQRRSIWH